MARPCTTRSVFLALSALLVLGPGVGCRQRPGEPRMSYARQLSNGRPDTCPDDAFDASTVVGGPTDLRCSYADAMGAPITRIRGRVLVEGPPGSPGESPGRIEVVVHEAPAAIGGPLGKEVARASTDPQGAFTVGAKLPAGEYVVAVPGPGVRTLARVPITVGGAAGQRIEGVRLVIPRPLDDDAP